jgi:hypothetical protein
MEGKWPQERYPQRIPTNLKIPRALQRDVIRGCDFATRVITHDAQGERLDAGRDYNSSWRGVFEESIGLCSRPGTSQSITVWAKLRENGTTLRRGTYRYMLKDRGW